MSIVAKVIFGPGGMPTPHDGRYVVAWDSNVPYGTLAVTSTPDIAKAKVFDLAGLIEEYSRISRVAPLRPDGEPNRPLRALTIDIIDISC